MADNWRYRDLGLGHDGLYMNHVDHYQLRDGPSHASTKNDNMGHRTHPLPSTLTGLWDVDHRKEKAEAKQRAKQEAVEAKEREKDAKERQRIRAEQAAKDAKERIKLEKELDKAEAERNARDAKERERLQKEQDERDKQIAKREKKALKKTSKAGKPTRKDVKHVKQSAPGLRDASNDQRPLKAKADYPEPREHISPLKSLPLRPDLDGLDLGVQADSPPPLVDLHFTKEAADLQHNAEHTHQSHSSGHVSPDLNGDGWDKIKTREQRMADGSGEEFFGLMARRPADVSESCYSDTHAAMPTTIRSFGWQDPVHEPITLEAAAKTNDVALHQTLEACHTKSPLADSSTPRDISPERVPQVTPSMGKGSPAKLPREQPIVLTDSPSKFKDNNTVSLPVVMNRSDPCSVHERPYEAPASSPASKVTPQQWLQPISDPIQLLAGSSAMTPKPVIQIQAPETVAQVSGPTNPQDDLLSGPAVLPDHSLWSTTTIAPTPVHTTDGPSLIPTVEQQHDPILPTFAPTNPWHPGPQFVHIPGYGLPPSQWDQFELSQVARPMSRAAFAQASGYRAPYVETEQPSMSVDQATGWESMPIYTADPRTHDPSHRPSSVLPGHYAAHAYPPQARSSFEWGALRTNLADMRQPTPMLYQPRPTRPYMMPGQGSLPSGIDYARPPTADMHTHHALVRSRSTSFAPQYQMAFDRYMPAVKNVEFGEARRPDEGYPTAAPFTHRYSAGATGQAGSGPGPQYRAAEGPRKTSQRKASPPPDMVSGAIRRHIAGAFRRQGRKLNPFGKGENKVNKRQGNRTR